MAKLMIPLDALTYGGSDKKRDHMRKIVRLHAVISPRLLEAFDCFSDNIIAGTDHHERMDGKGVFRKTANKLSLLARIMIITDAIEAMLSNRSYRHTKNDVYSVIAELYYYTNINGEYRYDIECVGAAAKTLNKFMNRNLFLYQSPSHWFDFNPTSSFLKRLSYRPLVGWLRLSPIKIIVAGLGFAVIAAILTFWVLPDPSLPSVAMLSLTTGLISPIIQLPRLIMRWRLQSKQATALTPQNLASQSQLWLLQLESDINLPKAYDGKQIKFELLPESTSGKWWQSIKLGHGEQTTNGYVIQVHPLIHHLPIVLQLAVIRHEIWEAYHGSHIKASYYELTYVWKNWLNTWKQNLGGNAVNQPVQDIATVAKPEISVSIKDVVDQQKKLGPIIAGANEIYQPAPNRLSRLLIVLKQSSLQALAIFQPYQLFKTMVVTIVRFYQGRDNVKPQPHYRRFHRGFVNAA